MPGTPICGFTEPVCSASQREVEKVRISIWHKTQICEECFLQWYDPDNNGFDSNDPKSLGNYVRQKNGLPLL